MATVRQHVFLYLTFSCSQAGKTMQSGFIRCHTKKNRPPQRKGWPGSIESILLWLAHSAREGTPVDAVKERYADPGRAIV